ncbi:MAG: type IX secretion system sortase PorU, partial [candidate division KSB1 bacterium]|nr:type IX secretion system sortase PorU [candidate division KSB1 bacterium]
WFEIQYKKQFIADDNQLRFSQAGDNSAKFQLSNFSESSIEIYDISDAADVQFITNTEIMGTSVTFVEPNASSLRREYLAVSPKAFLVPEKIEPATFADLRQSITGADFIIISHDDFYQAVLPLAQHREVNDSLKTVVVKISDIYNEFAWGLFDPTAIRDFIKFAYDHWNPVPKYVLLCGDGDYDYKNIKSKLDKNWIPAYQTTELNENVNRTMDDWFVQVSGSDEQPDLAIGRFPVQSVEETQNVVEKIIRYQTLPLLSSDQTAPLDDWRNVVTMVGDDEVGGAGNDNETMHINDAENIIENYIPNFFNKEKIYLIEYPAVKDPSTSGVMKPEATAALLDRIEKGTLILNYVGHGAPSLWAHERLLKENRDYERIQNADRLPLWVAATCDFGRFDDPMEQSFSEKLFSARQRGGIAFLTSARLAYASDNTALNREFFNQLFIANQTPTARLGVALMRAKNRNYSTTNDQKYHLFGDPSMRLAAPKYSAQIISIQPDTLKALSEMKVKGQIQSQNSVWNEFEGKALLKVFDSAVDKVYLTKYNSPIRYRARGKTVFRGLLSVRGGQFEGRLIVPKDITYGANLGRISIYFADAQHHGTGFRNAIKVGGTSTLQDNEGPLINIGVAGQNFVDGSLVNQNAVLEIEIADSISGVNIAGDIGHHITMVVDEQEDQKIYLTELFNYYEGNFKAGKVRYDLSSFKRTTFDQNNVPTIEYGLPAGDHTITVKAWDNFNNSAIATARLTIVSEQQLRLQHVLNFPNPFSDATTFTFVINHPSEVAIKIFTVSGRLIETLDHLAAEAGMNQIDWNGRDRQGDELANGVYLYKVIATARPEGKTLRDEYIGKLVIMR